jgi:LuxR family maltose regulon positive regulatory protein
VVVPGIGPAWNDEADHAVYIAWSKVQILLGKPGDALSVIQPMLEVAQEHGLIHRVIELSLLKAQAFYVQGQKDRAWQPLRLALSLAEKNGYQRLIDQDKFLIHLLKDAMKLGIMPDFIRRILDINWPDANQGQPRGAFRDIPKTGIQESMDTGLVEPLSSREKEVLVLMAEGLSNPEIAARLFLSPNTLKAHTQNIFGKLNVHNRVQAVNKARDLKLI